MTLDRFITLTALSGMLAACSSTGSQQTTDAARQESAKGRQNQQLKFKLASGVYQCELGQSVEIQRDTRNANLIEVNWQGKRHTLQRFDSSSGLPRYEDRQNGLLWIDLPWKSVLMDSNNGRPLANECKMAQNRAKSS
jgi:hypothetical protein